MNQPTTHLRQALKLILVSPRASVSDKRARQRGSFRRSGVPTLGPRNRAERERLIEHQYGYLRGCYDYSVKARDHWKAKYRAFSRPEFVGQVIDVPTLGAVTADEEFQRTILRDIRGLIDKLAADVQQFASELHSHIVANPQRKPAPARCRAVRVRTPRARSRSRRTRVARAVAATATATGDPGGDPDPEPGDRARQRAVASALTDAARARAVNARDHLAWFLALHGRGGAA